MSLVVAGAGTGTGALLFSSCHHRRPKLHFFRPPASAAHRNRPTSIRGSPSPRSRFPVCHVSRRSTDPPETDGVTKAVQVALWAMESVYILWLFLLPYAPGDPVWAISAETVNSLIGLSLNFFFVLPLMNAVGIHLIEAPVLHPASEALFNFVIGWTFLFAPLLFTDRRRDRYGGSLEVLWGAQMFLTNTFLIPYMAIRMNETAPANRSSERSQLGRVMTNGAPVVGLIGAAACLVSAIWGLYGRPDGGFGGVNERWEFLINYLGSDRVAYAFVWDICLYIIFQPWLIGDNLQNVKKSKVGIVKYLRFVPVMGLIAYLLCLNLDGEL